MNKCWYESFHSMSDCVFRAVILNAVLHASPKPFAASKFTSFFKLHVVYPYLSSVHLWPVSEKKSAHHGLFHSLDSMLRVTCIIISFGLLLIYIFCHSLMTTKFVACITNSIASRLFHLGCEFLQLLWSFPCCTILYPF